MAVRFASKEAFGAEVMDAYFDRNEGKLRAVLGNADVAPLARLEA
jgi:TetR/AcrR family transcriptional regulator, transcriptional repressor for nem operon